MKLVHYRTKKLLDSYCKKPGKPVLLVGNRALGVYEILDELTHTLLDKSHKNQVILVASESSKAISIEQIRDIQSRMTTKQPSNSHVSRFVIFDCSNGISDEAQQALLKTLEEPPHGNLLCIIIPDTSLVRPTILSRCQHIPVLPITRSQAREYAQQLGIDTSEADQAYYITAGASFMYISMLENKNDPLVEQITSAKSFLRMTVFERLVQFKNYDTKDSFESLIQSLLTITSGAMRHTSGPIHEWKRKQKVLLSIIDALHAQATVKLLYTQLCIELS